MRAYVTGGSGFVGRNLIQRLRARGDEVRALARSDASARAVEAAGAVAVPGDLADAEALQAGLAGCDCLFHSAAEVSDWGDPQKFHRINVLGTERVLEAARAAGVPRFVHVSTEAVLCDGGPLDHVDESHPYPEQPLALYPATKAEAERRVLAANSETLATVVVRPRLIWGAGDTSLLPGFVAAVHAGKFAWINGGRFPVSITHVGNVCEGLLLAAERGRGGEVYFLSDGAPVELRKFMQDLLVTQGLDPGERELPLWLARAIAASGALLWRRLPLPGQPPLTPLALWLMSQSVTVNDSKAREQLGYRGQISYDAGMAELSRPARAE